MPLERPALAFPAPYLQKHASDTTSNRVPQLVLLLDRHRSWHGSGSEVMEPFRDNNYLQRIDNKMFLEIGCALGSNPAMPHPVAMR